MNIAKIKPYPKNAKAHPKVQIEKIANSIREFGFNQPIVIDKTNTIIVGHGRYEAAKMLGMTDVPIIKAELSHDQAKAYRLADNKLNESDWLMETVLEELKSMDLALVDLTGFERELIMELKEDEARATVPKIPRSQHGDLYEIGQHRVLCGDSTLDDDFKKLFGKERARLVFTDPPYSVDYVSTAGLSYESDKYGGTGGKIFNDDKSPEEARKFYEQTLKNIYGYTSEDMTLYWWYASRLQYVNQMAFGTQGFHMSQICIWLKNSLIYSPGQLYHRIYEPCMVGWKENGAPHYKDIVFASFSELWTLDKKTFADHLDAWYNKRDSTARYLHPTQKPVALAERALKRSSEKGDIVLDAFGGSGSTLMGCEQLERRCFTMELDPKYVDVIVQRWVDFTGNTSVTKNGHKEEWQTTPEKKTERRALKKHGKQKKKELATAH